MLLTSTVGIIMSAEILVEKPVRVPPGQKARISNDTEPMPPRTEVDFSPLFSVAQANVGG